MEIFCQKVKKFTLTYILTFMFILLTYITIGTPTSIEANVEAGLPRKARVS